MFKFALQLKNPFFKENDNFLSKTYFHFENKLFGTKAINFQISRFDSYYLVDFDLDIRFSGRDHAGPNFDFWILGFGLNLNLYDVRHWDYENECWINTK